MQIKGRAISRISLYYAKTRPHVNATQTRSITPLPFEKFYFQIRALLAWSAGFLEKSARAARCSNWATRFYFAWPGPGLFGNAIISHATVGGVRFLSFSFFFAVSRPTRSIINRRIMLLLPYRLFDRFL